MTFADSQGGMTTFGRYYDNSSYGYFTRRRYLRSLNIYNTRGHWKFCYTQNQSGKCCSSILGERLSSIHYNRRDMYEKSPSLGCHYCNVNSGSHFISSNSYSDNYCSRGGSPYSRRIEDFDTDYSSSRNFFSSTRRRCNSY